MSSYQHTIGNAVSCSGVGLHTGEESTITFKPAPENSGIKFIRTDIDGHPEVAADISNVVDISRGTSISQNGVKVNTVEHVLAAVSGLEIDNVNIELTTKEPPVLDGSSLEFVKILQKVGIVEQKQPREYLVIDRTITYSDSKNNADLSVLPSDQFRITCIIDYKSTWLGTQYLTIHSIKDFVEKIAPARTFCFLSEVEGLMKSGLIKGGGLENSIVFIDKEIDDKEINRLKSLFNINRELVIGSNGILDGTELRYKNEPVRHKALDLIGDLALLGVPINGHVIAARTGHKANVEFIKKIKKEYNKKMSQKQNKHQKTNDYFLDIKDIMSIMPHRYPFILVDRIQDMTPGERLVAIKNVTINEPFFQGHFPGDPIMPGVLILEAMAQAGGFLLMNTVEDVHKTNVFFSGIENARFRHPVVPGDQLRFEIELVKMRLGACKFRGKAYVGDKIVAEAIFLGHIVDREIG